MYRKNPLWIVLRVTVTNLRSIPYEIEREIEKIGGEMGWNVKNTIVDIVDMDITDSDSCYSVRAQCALNEDGNDWKNYIKGKRDDR